MYVNGGTARIWKVSFSFVLFFIVLQHLLTYNDGLESKEKERTNERNEFILYPNTYGFITFFLLLRFQQQMLHVLHRRVREHALLREWLYMYVGMIMNKQKKPNQERKKKCKFVRIILLCCAHWFLISFTFFHRNKLWHLLFNQIKKVTSYHCHYWNIVQ